MSYKTLHLSEIAIPEDSEVKKNTEWRHERAPGVGLYIQHIADEIHLPNYVDLSDKRSGFKYGVYVAMPSALNKDDRYGTRGYAGQMANVDLKLRNLHGMRYQAEVYTAKRVERGIGKHSFSFQDDRIVRVWTCVKNDYATLIDLVSGLIEEAAQAVYKDEDDEIPKIDEISIVKLKKTNKFAYDGKIYYDLGEMFDDIVNHVLPGQLSAGIIKAMSAWKPGESTWLNCCIDSEKSALVFYEDDKKPFYTFECPLLKQCDTWLKKLDLNLRQESGHWLQDAFQTAKTQGAFKNIARVTVLGEYDYGAADMDVVFEIR